MSGGQFGEMVAGTAQDRSANAFRIAGFWGQPGQMRCLGGKIVQTLRVRHISTVSGGRAGTQVGVKWRKKNAKLHCSGRPGFETIRKPGQVNARRREVRMNTQVVGA